MIIYRKVPPLLLFNPPAKNNKSATDFKLIKSKRFINKIKLFNFHYKYYFINTGLELIILVKIYISKLYLLLSIGLKR